MARSRGAGSRGGPAGGSAGAPPRPPSKGRRAVRLVLGLLPSFLPKACPGWWATASPAVVAGVFSSMGVAFLLEPRWLLPLTAVLLLPAVLVLFRDARRRRYWPPFCLGLPAAVAILLGKFQLEADSVMYGGMVLLVATSIWSFFPVRRRLPAPDPLDEDEALGGGPHRPRPPPGA